MIAKAMNATTHRSASYIYCYHSPLHLLIVPSPDWLVGCAHLWILLLVDVVDNDEDEIDQVDKLEVVRIEQVAVRWEWIQPRHYYHIHPSSVWASRDQV